MKSFKACSKRIENKLILSVTLSGEPYSVVTLACGIHLCLLQIATLSEGFLNYFLSRAKLT